MENLIQSDIFFFVTTISIVIIAVFMVIALIYLIQILRNVKDASVFIKKKAFFLALDAPILKSWIKNIIEFFTPKKAKKRSKKKRV